MGAVRVALIGERTHCRGGRVCASLRRVFFLFSGELFFFLAFSFYGKPKRAHD
jgi:hypothetical protein